MAPLLELDGVAAGYGRIEVLHGLSLSVPAGAVVALIGANGVGKTTTLRAIAGLVAVRRGRIRLAGQRIDGLSPYAIARRGLTLMPEDRGVFPSLTVSENLRVAARGRDEVARAAAIDEVGALFPRLAQRSGQQAATLSGGEQQMLALARAFLVEPRVLLLDEISMGLAPMVIADLYDRVAALRERGTTIVLVEQFLSHALRLADICYVMRKGAIAFAGDAGELAATRPGNALEVA